jgi:hypothetical protein
MTLNHTRWAGHVVYNRGRQDVHKEFLCGSFLESNHLEDQEPDGGTTGWNRGDMLCELAADGINQESCP